MYSAKLSYISFTYQFWHLNVLYLHHSNTNNSSSSSLLSIVSDDDISVRFRPLCALIVGENKQLIINIIINIKKTNN